MEATNSQTIEGMLAWQAVQYAEKRWVGFAKVKRQRTVDDFIAGAMWMQGQTMAPLLDHIVAAIEREKAYRKYLADTLGEQDGSAVRALSEVLNYINVYRKSGGF